MYGLISHVNGLGKKKTKRRVLNILNVLKKRGGGQEGTFPQIGKSYNQGRQENI
jgi:hypothetical protein